MNKKHIIYPILGGLIVFTLIFVYTGWQIGVGVQSICAQAQERYTGDCAGALDAFLKDENNPYRERNSAIWALGQLGDKRVLQTLETYYTGDVPEKEPLDEGLSQHELKKAIALIEGAVNITSFVWR